MELGEESRQDQKLLAEPGRQLNISPPLGNVAEGMLWINYAGHWALMDQLLKITTKASL